METKYECDQCGACCQGYLIVEVYGIDVMREPRLATADPGYQRTDESLELAHELEVNDHCLVIAAGPRPCPLLGEDFTCAVYPSRPNVCVALEAGDDQCQYARQQARLPPLAPR